MIEVVAHCYCPPGVTHYAEHLRWQWASLLRQECSERLLYTVFCDEHDSLTMHTFRRLSVNTDPQQLQVHLYPIAKRFLFRRAIGRNLIAQRTAADVVWYTDIDYCFGEGCMEAVAKYVKRDSPLVMPREILISTTHEIGQRMVDDNRDVLFPELDRSLFTARSQKVCIGGLHIVGGDFIRQAGYLHGTPWVEPVDDTLGFRSCRCDVAFRKSVGGCYARLDIPNVYRIRHTTDGRDYDVNGEVKGRASW